MRAFVPAYEIKTVQNLDEALSCLKKEPGVWRPFAGGTDLMVLFEAGRLEHKKYMALWNLSELKGIDVSTDAVRIGAMTSYAVVAAHPVLQKEFPMLCEAARLTGAVAIQNRGTLGGNIVNASPAADSPPALLAYDAELELVSSKGSRRIPLSEFYLGYKKMRLEPNELLHSVHLPRKAAGAVHYYRKVGTRKMQAISKVCFAGWLRVKNRAIGEARIALGSVAPTVLRCFKTEDFLKGKPLSGGWVEEAKKTLAGEIAPIDDIRSTKGYREKVAQNLLEAFLKQCGIGSQN